MTSPSQGNSNSSSSNFSFASFLSTNTSSASSSSSSSNSSSSLPPSLLSMMQGVQISPIPPSNPPISLLLQPDNLSSSSSQVEKDSPSKIFRIQHDSPQRVLRNEIEKQLKEPLRTSLYALAAFKQGIAQLNVSKTKDTFTQLLKANAQEMLRYVNAFMDKQKENALHVPSPTESKTDSPKSHPRQLAKPNVLKSHEFTHEVRQPINNILGILQLLEQEEVSKEELELYIESLEDSFGHISDCLAGPQPEENIPLSLEIKKFTLEKLQRKLRSVTAYINSQVKVQFSIPQELAKQSLLGDMQKLKQILINLISNAIKYSPKEQPHNVVEVSIQTQKIQDKTIIFRISVQDQGLGIPEKLQGTLFKDFAQLDNQPQSSSSSGSSGVGLALSQKYAQLMGGTIRIQSPLENSQRGTRFYFDLPFEKGKESPPEPSPLMTARRLHFPESSKTASENKRLNILFADDENTTRDKIVPRIFERAGKNTDYDLALAEDGETAVEEFSKQPYDVVILDMNMGSEKITGWETARQICQIAQDRFQPFPKIFFCSGDSLEQQQKEAAESTDPISQYLSGVTSYVKPVKYKNLAEQIFKSFSEKLDQ